MLDTGVFKKVTQSNYEGRQGRRGHENQKGLELAEHEPAVQSHLNTMELSPSYVKSFPSSLSFHPKCVLGPHNGPDRYAEDRPVSEEASNRYHGSGAEMYFRWMAEETDACVGAHRVAVCSGPNLSRTRRGGEIRLKDRVRCRQIEAPSGMR